MAGARNQVRMSADVPASREAVFDYLSNHFDEIWPGEMDEVREGSDPAEPRGLGFVRRMHTLAGKLEEEIVAHERPGLIEYKVINTDEAKIHNHLGRIELSERPGGGTRVDYAVSFDYRPPWQGPIGALSMRAAWWLRGKRRLAKLG